MKEMESVASDYVTEFVRCRPGDYDGYIRSIVEKAFAAGFVKSREMCLQAVIDADMDLNGIISSVVRLVGEKEVEE